MKTRILFSLLCIFVFSTLSANTLHVPSEYSTIQAGIDAASNGDVILVADGTYTGDGNKDISFGGKDVVVKSENGPGNCIIDCENSSFAIAFVINSGQSEACVVEGFTIKNAEMGFWIYANSNPTIQDNVIEYCYAGINCTSDSNPIIIGNTIRGNNNPGQMPQYGGGISVSWSAPIIVNNKIYDNSSDKGGGIYCFNSPSATIINNTIIDNAAIHGGGVYLDESPLNLTNNIIAFSQYKPGADDRIYSYYHTAEANYDGAKLVSMDYTFAIKNNGDSGLLNIKSKSPVGGREIDTSFQMASGERRTIYINSKVNEFGDYGGINVDFIIEDDLWNVQTEDPQSYFLTIAVDPDAKPASREVVEIGSGAAITHNDIFGNGEGDFYSGDSEQDMEMVSIDGVDGNITQDPDLISFDYSLYETSPCIDAGTTGLYPFDFNGIERPIGAGWDIGACEYEPATSVDDNNHLPEEFVLHQNYPNPFNPVTTIKYSLPAVKRIASFANEENNGSSQSGDWLYKVTLKIYDMLGREIATLVHEDHGPGTYTVNVDASDLPSGTYIYRLTVGSFTQSKKMLLLK